VHVNIPIKQSSFTHPRASFAHQDWIKWSNNYRENGMTVNYYKKKKDVFMNGIYSYDQS